MGPEMTELKSMWLGHLLLSTTSVLAAVGLVLLHSGGVVTLFSAGPGGGLVLLLGVCKSLHCISNNVSPFADNNERGNGVNSRKFERIEPQIT